MLGGGRKVKGNFHFSPIQLFSAPKGERTLPAKRSGENAAIDIESVDVGLPGRDFPLDRPRKKKSPGKSVD
jgi:hypothetical protein